MSYTVDIRDQVSPALQGLRQVPANVLPAIGAAVAKLFQQHYLAKPPNRMGWPSTNFWADAARSTTWAVEGVESVKVSTTKQGLLQRFKGGVIRAVNSKFLTIPARAEAYGRRAREFNDLVAIFDKNGGGMLVQAQQSALTFGRKRKDGSRKVTAREIGGAVFYWLRKSVNQDADPSVIPTDEQIGATALDQVQRAVQRALERGGASGVA